MKTTMLSMLFVFTSLVSTNSVNAQVRVGVNINIGDQPEWGPSGYDYAEYYYLPDIESYYCVPRRQFVYLSFGRWVFSASLPPCYAGYNLYTGYKVVCREHDAYRYFDDHRMRYAQYAHCHNRQPVIRCRYDNGNHYGHDKNRDWDHDRDRDWGNGRGHNRGREWNRGRGHD